MNCLPVKPDHDLDRGSVHVKKLLPVVAYVQLFEVVEGLVNETADDVDPKG